MNHPAPRLSSFCALLLCAALAACGEQAAPAEEGGGLDLADPLMSAALADQIMVDPDMVNRNAANQLAVFPDAGGAIPRPDAGPEAVAAARAEAMALIGGSGALRRAPPPERVAGELPPEAALSVAARAASAGGQGAGGQGMRDCAAQAQFSAVWAARMPAAFPVYPRGAVQEAAGTDAAGCALRVVSFATPVPVQDVMDFYFTRASAAGFRLQRALQGGDDVLGGTRGNRSVMVFARRGEGGLTTVDLVTAGN